MTNAFGDRGIAPTSPKNTNQEKVKGKIVVHLHHKTYHLHFPLLLQQTWQKLLHLQKPTQHPLHQLSWNCYACLQLYSHPTSHNTTLSTISHQFLHSSIPSNITPSRQSSSTYIFLCFSVYLVLQPILLTLHKLINTFYCPTYAFLARNYP